MPEPGTIAALYLSLKASKLLLPRVQVTLRLHRRRLVAQTTGQP